MEEGIKILFIADMHYSSDGILKNEEYVAGFIDSVSEESKDAVLDLLVIAGDLCDKGGNESTYREVAGFINIVMEKLKIESVVLVPGNHDVSRNALCGIKDKRNIDNSKLWQYSEKYKYFEGLKENQNINFDVEKAIVSQVIKKDKYLFLGVNTNYKIGLEDGYGVVDIEKLKREFEILKKEKGDSYSSLIKIVIMHHNPHFYGSVIEKGNVNNKLDANTTGNFELGNWNQVKKIFSEYGVDVVLTGHVHGSQTKAESSCNEGEKEIYYSSVGSIGVNFNNELKRVLESTEQSNTSQEERKNLENILTLLERNCVSLSTSNRHNTYSLIEIEEGKLKEQHYKRIVDEGVVKWVPWYASPKNRQLYEPEKKGINPFEEINEDAEVGNAKERGTHKAEDIRRKLMEIVREEHLFKTGHFHWKEQCAMNWIDTSVLLTNISYLNLISDYIVQQFERELREAQYIIGLGMKGAIMMSNIRYKYPEKKFSYCPENEENYNIFEKNVLDDGEMDKLVLLTDVVHSGKTIENFVKKNSNIISNRSEINVITIFLTDDINEKNINVSKGKDKSRRIVIKIKGLMKMPINNCGRSYQNCNVYQEKLDIVYKMQ